nr:MAG TPA_asm: hypothetical protein [Caudoviricetes sp.]
MNEVIVSASQVPSPLGSKRHFYSPFVHISPKFQRKKIFYTHLFTFYAYTPPKRVNKKAASLRQDIRN